MALQAGTTFLANLGLCDEVTGEGGNQEVDGGGGLISAGGGGPGLLPQTHLLPPACQEVRDPLAGGSRCIESQT